MAHSEEIGRELRSISGMIAGLPAEFPLGVPPGFFEAFPQRILDLVRSEDSFGEGQGEEDAPIGAVGPLIDIPIGGPIDIRSLRDLPTLQVPEGYFDHLADDILKRIRLGEKEESGSGEKEDALPSILTGLKELPTFRAPAGYFDGLPEYLTRVAMAAGEGQEGPLEEIQRLSPLLASLQGQYPGQVPPGYFEHFPKRTREALLRSYQAAGPSEGRRTDVPAIEMNNRLFPPLRKFLAAAVTIGAVLLSAVWGYHIYDRPADFIRSGVNIKTEAQFNTALAKLSDQDIMDYLGSNTDVSDADLIASEVEDNPDGTQAAPQSTVNGSGQAGRTRADKTGY